MSDSDISESISPSGRVISAAQELFSAPVRVWIFAGLAAALLLLYGLLLAQLTSIQALVQNTTFYNIASLIYTLLAALSGALALTQSAYFAKNDQAQWLAGSIVWALVGIGLGAVSSGCSTCDSRLLPALGIAGGLATFPLGGLELKALGLLILLGVVWENIRIMTRNHALGVDTLLRVEGESIVIGAQLVRYLKVAGVFSIALLALYLVPEVSAQYGTGLGAELTGSQIAPDSNKMEQLLKEINPPQGYTLSIHYGDIGPRLIAAGAIDQERFVQLYADGGNPLTDDQLHILTKGSDSQVVINSQNAHFLLNLLWALGLANKNTILDRGPLMQASEGQIEQFASTGGWTLGARRVSELYSSTLILPLTQEQQARVDEAAANTYRPCCNNSTAFADCNHGMAMLGLFELMASQGATVDEMYQAAKYFNAFWFPQQAIYLAMYFNATTGQSFAEVDPRVVVSAQYSSGSGASTVQQWLAQNGKLPQVPGGGSCGT